jgi:cytochrome P450
MTAVKKAYNHMYGKDPYSIPLEDYDVSQPALFESNTMWGFFDRLRKEEPVHYCKDSENGPFWSVTKFNDIMTVEGNPQIYSSEPSIGIADPREELPLKMFIAMDEPKHGVQRKTVQGIVAPSSLAKMEGLIRQRIAEILDSAAGQRDLQLGRPGVDRTDHPDAGHAVRLSVRAAPQTHLLV